jgi:hypothetical protein
MAERVLAEPLSGEEVILAIADRISTVLRRDCFLSKNLAYDSFDCDVKISLRLHDVGRSPEVSLDQNISAEVEGANIEDQFLDQAETEFKIEKAPPNEVRVETGQEVPVLTKDSEGNPTIKKVKYSRKQLQKAAQ